MFGARVCELGSTLSARLRILALYALFTLRERLRMGRSRAHRIRLDLLGRQLDWLVRDRADLAVLFEVFMTREYEGPSPQGAELVLDLGAHTGASVVWWRHLYPAAEIVAVEPDPESFELLARNVGDDARVRLIQAALAPGTGPTAFVSAPQSWESHLSRGADEAATSVPGVSLENLLAQVTGGRRIDLLKADIEGAERWLLDSSLASVSALVVEMHDSGGAPIEGADLHEVAAREGMRQLRGRSPGVAWLVRDESSADR
jgi:FkbM family methyltransferase